MRRLHGLRAAALVLGCAGIAASCVGLDRTSERVTTRAASRVGTTTAPSTTTTGPATTTTGPATDTGSGNAVTIAFGGDVHFAPPLDSALARSPATMLDGVKPALASADLSIVNLETSIGSGGDRQPKAFNFQAPPTAFDALTAAGVDVIGMANNHSLDYGRPGLAQTLAAVSARKAPVIGLGADDDDAFAPLVARVKGQRIAFIAATQVLDGNLTAAWTATATHPGVASAKRVDRLTRAVSEARRAADTVVVFLHWGTELEHCPNPAQLDLAPRLVEAGADIIVGGHAHRLQGGGYLGRAYVAYGLGNFMFKVGGGEGAETGVLTVEVTGRRVDGATWQPARIGGDFRPTLLPAAAAGPALARWEGYRSCAKLAGAPSGG